MNITLHRLILVKEVLRYLAPACIFPNQQLGIDPTFQVSTALLRTINLGSFWDFVESAAHANDVIGKFLGTFESFSASLSTEFASLLVLRRVHVKTAK